MNNLMKIAILILQGFTFKTAKEYLFYQKKYKNRPEGRYSIKQIMSVLPFNSKFDKLFEDLLSIRMVLAEFENNLPVYYCIKLMRDDTRFFCSLQEDGLEYDANKLASLLREKGQLDIKKSKPGFKSGSYVCKAVGDSFSVNDQDMEETEFLAFLNGLGDDYLVLEHVTGRTATLTTINEDGKGPHVVDSSADTDHLNALVLRVASAFPEVEYMHFTIVDGEDKKAIVNVETGVDLVVRNEFSEELSAFLDKKLHLKKRTRAGLINTVKRYTFTYIAQKKGFVDYMYRNWLRGKKEDIRSRTVSRREMKWAHKRGFYSYRIAQYGLTEENYRDFLSDYAYKRLRPINNEYRKWLWDKLSLYYILKKYSYYLPAYYYHIVPKEQGNLFFAMNGCPQDIEASAQGLIELLRRKGKLVLKPVIASHGEGFYKFSFVDGTFLVNDEKVSQSDMENLLAEMKVDYLVTEYIEMHRDLKRIYPNVACTIRAMVINRRGYNPVMEDTYFRIGTKKTGQTDNLASGGIFVHIDEITGAFANAKVTENHVIKPCEYHPDTNEKIEGVIPFWQEIRAGIVELSRYISPMEYMGFDIIVTDTGFKILEINTHQDLHRYPEYNDRIKTFFREKCEYKEKHLK